MSLKIGECGERRMAATDEKAAMTVNVYLSSEPKSQKADYCSHALHHPQRLERVSRPAAAHQIEVRGGQPAKRSNTWV